MRLGISGDAADFRWSTFDDFDHFDVAGFDAFEFAGDGGDVDGFWWDENGEFCDLKFCYFYAQFLTHSRGADKKLV